MTIHSIRPRRLDMTPWSSLCRAALPPLITIPFPIAGPHQFVVPHLIRIVTHTTLLLRIRSTPCRPTVVHPAAVPPLYAVLNPTPLIILKNLLEPILRTMLPLASSSLPLMIHPS